MNLCIDQGNSRTKIAIIDKENTIVKTLIYKQFTSQDVERLFSLYPLTHSIISSVVNIEPSLVNTLHRLSQQFILFDHQTPIPIQNDYASPESLGQDRLAAAVGAANLCPNMDLLIIDAGSAITYDVMTADGHYLGGNIAPGIKMRLRALHQFTKKLPMAEMDENALIPLFGKTTLEAISAGVIRGVAFEVKGYISTLSKRGKKLQVFLTGGNAPYILNHISTPMQYEKHLVLMGLNTILTYNKEHTTNK